MPEGGDGPDGVDGDDKASNGAGAAGLKRKREDRVPRPEWKGKGKGAGGVPLPDGKGKGVACVPLPDGKGKGAARVPLPDEDVRSARDNSAARETDGDAGVKRKRQKRVRFADVEDLDGGEDGVPEPEPALDSPGADTGLETNGGKELNGAIGLKRRPGDRVPLSDVKGKGAASAPLPGAKATGHDRARKAKK